LHQRQFKSNKNRNRQSSNDSADNCSAQAKKKRGAPKGHPGWFRRKPDHVDKTVVVAAPDICPHCACTDLSPIEKIKDHLQEDIVLQPRPQVTNFKHHQAFCPQCNRPVIQAAEGELLNCKIGPTTKAAAVFLRYGLRIPYRKVQELFEVLFNMPFVPASAMAFDRTATRRGEPLYEDLKEKLLRKPKFQDQRSIRFCGSVSTLLKKACEIGQKLNSGDIEPNKADAFEKRLYAAFNSICN